MTMGDNTASDLQSRYRELHAEMLAGLEETSLRENHGLIYMLLGWQHLIACAVTNYLIEVVRLPYPHRWPYLLPWLAWVLLALATVRWVRGRRPAGESPLGVLLFRTWTVFFLLCGNVVALNYAAGLPIFAFLPVLSTLSAFGLSILTVVVSRRFWPAILLMFVTGLVCARFPAYGLTIYGVSWLMILQMLGIILMRRRRDLASSFRAQ
jgi:FtsH-binding integral membrane protein